MNMLQVAGGSAGPELSPQSGHGISVDYFSYPTTDSSPDELFIATAQAPIAMTLCSITLLLFFFLSIPEPPSFKPTVEQWRGIVEAAAGEYLPAKAVGCGVISNGADAADAIRCVQRAQRRREAFWILSEGPGMDSKVWNLVIGERRDLRSVMLDSYGWQARGEPSFTAYEMDCKSLRFGETFQKGAYKFHEPAVSCDKK